MKLENQSLCPWIRNFLFGKKSFLFPQTPLFPLTVLKDLCLFVNIIIYVFFIFYFFWNLKVKGFAFGSKIVCSTRKAFCFLKCHFFPFNCPERLLSFQEYYYICFFFKTWLIQENQRLCPWIRDCTINKKSFFFLQMSLFPFNRSERLLPFRECMLGPLQYTFFYFIILAFQSIWI